MTSRNQLRRQLRQARNQLTPAEQESAAHDLLKQLKEQAHAPLAELTPVSKVALYLTNDGEISPHAICQWLWQHNIFTYLPSIHGETLVFAHYHPDNQWQKNQFGIAEPIDTAPLSGDDMDLVLMPLVGFDLKGGRLGMGGGYYDKTFAKRSARLIGLAHDCQQVDKLPIEDWDVPLDAIATPSLYLDISKLLT